MPSTIASTVISSDDFNILELAVVAAGLAPALSDPEADLTVFAPTDAAFVALAMDLGLDVDPSDEAGVFGAIAGALADLNGGDAIPLLKNILLYHVSPGAKLLEEVAALKDVPTLLDGATFSPDGTSLIDNEPDLTDPALVDTDLEVENGVIHVIDRVLLPIDIPGNEPQQIVVEAEDMDLSGYTVKHDSDASGDELIKLSGKQGSASTEFSGVSGEYDLELFYFDEIDGKSTIDVLVNGESVQTIKLDQHLGGVVATAGNATSATIESLHLNNGDTVEFVGTRSFFEFARIDKAVFTPAESEPIPTIAEIATAAGSFEILLMALDAADLTSAFTDPKGDPLTVFAPTDEAFYKLAHDFGFDGEASDKAGIFNAIAEALTGLAEDGNPIPLLTDILLYHVTDGAQSLADVAALEDVPTLLPGATFSPDVATLSLVDNEPDLQDPTLEDTDIEASNGIIHVIDRVLLPIDIPGNEPIPTIVVEAEDMQLDGYRVQHDKDASEDQLIKLSSWKGEASTSFDGKSGEYDLELFYFDEIDGRSTVDILINGEKVEKVKFDDHLGGFTATSDNATSVVIEDLQLEHGDTISFIGKRSFLEFARLDKIVLTQSLDDDMDAPDNTPEDMMI